MKQMKLHTLSRESRVRIMSQSIQGMRLQSREVFTPRNGQRQRRKGSIRFTPRPSSTSRIRVIKGYVEGNREIECSILQVGEV